LSNPNAFAHRDWFNISNVTDDFKLHAVLSIIATLEKQNDGKMRYTKDLPSEERRQDLPLLETAALIVFQSAWISVFSSKIVRHPIRPTAESQENQYRCAHTSRQR